MPQPNKPLAKSSSRNVAPRREQSLLIDPRWMLKAIGAVVLLAAVCGYIAICGLFWQGQWQLVLSPSRNVAATPQSAGLEFEDLHFGPGAGGQPELTGWWVPAADAVNPTVLLLHGGSGNMADVLRQIHLLHDTRLNVLAFDYRGFGRSSGSHPTEQQMEQDSEAALHYVNDIRHISNGQVIVFGEGLGASLTTRLCAEHHDIAALVLESADGDFESRVALDGRSRMVPVSLLFNQRFPLADPLHMLTTPKLLLSFTKAANPPVDFSRAADPKLTVEIASREDTANWSAAVRRFLDSYVTRPPAQLLQHAR